MLVFFISTVTSCVFQFYGQYVSCGEKFIQMQRCDLTAESRKVFHRMGECFVDHFWGIDKERCMCRPVGAVAESFFQTEDIVAYIGCGKKHLRPAEYSYMVEGHIKCADFLRCFLHKGFEFVLPFAGERTKCHMHRDIFGMKSEESLAVKFLLYP